MLAYVRAHFSIEMVPEMFQIKVDQQAALKWTQEFVSLVIVFPPIIVL